MMKRLIIMAVAALLCMAVSAQNTLKGSWMASHSMMGISMNDTFTFDSDERGTVTEHADVKIRVSLFGVKVSGAFECSVSGTFERKNDKVIIKWDADKFTYKITEKPKGTVKGKPDEKLQKQAEEMINDALNDCKKSAGETDTYDPVTVKNGKLTMTTRNKEGKKEKETYKFVETKK